MGFGGYWIAVLLLQAPASRRSVIYGSMYQGICMYLVWFGFMNFYPPRVSGRYPGEAHGA